MWVMCGVIAATVAGGKGQSAGAWMLLGFLLGPFGLLLVLMPSPALDVPQDIPSVGSPGDMCPCPMDADARDTVSWGAGRRGTVQPATQLCTSKPPPLIGLSPAHTAEAAPSLHTLRQLGYDIIELDTTWIITTQTGEIVASVSSLEALQAFVDTPPGS